jgi:hypothetical protein
MFSSSSTITTFTVCLRKRVRLPQAQSSKSFPKEQGVPFAPEVYGGGAERRSRCECKQGHCALTPARDSWCKTVRQSCAVACTGGNCDLAISVVARCFHHNSAQLLCFCMAYSLISSVWTGIRFGPPPAAKLPLTAQSTGAFLSRQPPHDRSRPVCVLLFGCQAMCEQRMRRPTARTRCVQNSPRVT